MYQTLDTIQPEQIDGLIKSHNYRYISLRDSAGRVLIPNNQSGQSALKNRVLEVKQRLQVVPDNSIYYIILKNTTHGEEWAYKYIKGNPVQIINTAPAPVAMSEQTQYANYADKVSEQAAEIARLKNEIDNLNACVTDYIVLAGSELGPESNLHSLGVMVMQHHDALTAMFQKFLANVRNVTPPLNS